MTNRVRLLIIDDEPAIRRFLRASLADDAYHISDASTAREGVRKVATEQPDVVLLDLGLPDGDGLDVVSEIRQWSSVPIVVLSARERERDKIDALDAGADDYLTKPFGVGELTARLRAAVRRARSSDSPLPQPVVTGDLIIDLISRQVSVHGHAVKLTKTEFNFLALLARHLGQVLTHRQLLLGVWGPEYEFETHYLRVYAAQIRQKIEPDPARPHYLLTETGVGYRLSLIEGRQVEL